MSILLAGAVIATAFGQQTVAILLVCGYLGLRELYDSALRP